MPYSISHAIVAIPVSKLTGSQVPIAAVALGAVSPDFPYFVAMTPTTAHGHDISHLVTHCLLPSLLLLWVWFRWLETPTLIFWNLNNSPKLSRKALTIGCIIGVLIGALSHILWDATSHSYGVIAKNSELLQQTFFSKPLYKWNQYVSGIAGLAILISWYLGNLYRNSKKPYNGNLMLGAAIYLVSIILFIVFGLMFHQHSSLVDVVITISITVVNGMLLGAVLYALLTRIIRVRR